jgi:hypothetical protein
MKGEFVKLAGTCGTFRSPDFLFVSRKIGKSRLVSDSGVESFQDRYATEFQCRVMSRAGSVCRSDISKKVAECFIRPDRGGSVEAFVPRTVARTRRPPVAMESMVLNSIATGTVTTTERKTYEVLRKDMAKSPAYRLGRGNRLGVSSPG